MSTLKKDHVLGAGTAALAGGAAGAAIGAVVAGPAGLAVGAAAGGALGAIYGNRASEAADTRHDLGHFQQIFKTMPYYVGGHDWHDYAPAYRYGLDTWPVHRGQPLEAVESQLQGGWEAAARFGSRLQWQQARPAVAHAWQSLQDAAERKPPKPTMPEAVR
jgi:hypothetical protein